MQSIFDHQEIGFDCPECGHGLRETVGKLKTSPKIQCPACKVTIAIDANELASAVGELDKSIDDLRKVFD